MTEPTRLDTVLPLLEFAATAEEPDLRVAALAAAARLPLDETCWLEHSRVTGRVIGELPPGSDERRAALDEVAFVDAKRGYTCWFDEDFRQSEDIELWTRMAATTDWRFSPARSRELVNGLLAARKAVSYVEIDAAQGHDAFLLPIPRYVEALSRYMNQIEVDR